MSSDKNKMQTDTADAKPWLWKPGNSGNPKGGSVSIRQVSLIATLRRKVAADMTRKQKRGKPVTGTVADHIVEELINLALNCKVQKVKLMAIIAILDRLEGKPVTPVAVTPAETELVSRVKLAYQAVLQFAEINGLQMTPETAAGIVAAREPKAREILADVITIDVEATSTDGTDGNAS